MRHGRAILAVPLVVLAAMSNAVAFTRKVDGSAMLSATFACVGVSLR